MTRSPSCLSKLSGWSPQRSCRHLDCLVRQVLSASRVQEARSRSEKCPPTLPGGPAGDAELVLGVLRRAARAASGRRVESPASTFSSSAFAASSCAWARASSISFTLTASSTSASARSSSTLKKPGPGRELEDLVRADVDARRACLQRRDERRVPREHADLAGSAGDDQHVRLALEDRAVGRDDLDVERRMVGDVRHRARATPRPARAGRAFSLTSSIGPTM